MKIIKVKSYGFILTKKDFWGARQYLAFINGNWIWSYCNSYLFETKELAFANAEKVKKS
jgi:hypothetical protein